MLNEKRESVLLSPISDHEALAANMIRVMESEELSNTLINNALLTNNELYGNKSNALKTREVYKVLLNIYENKDFSASLEMTTDLMSFRPTEGSGEILTEHETT